MPQIADVKLSSILSTTHRTTSATVGVDATFSPAGFQTPGVAKWENRVDGIIVGYPYFTLSVRPPLNKGARVIKTTVKVVLPTLEQTSPSTATGIQPAPTKAYDVSCVMEFMCPERSTQAERLKLLSYVASLFNATINASDDVPTDATGSPLIAAVSNGDPPF